MDIRLRTETFSVGGRDYTVACNMNVLADVQEWHNGDLVSALDGTATIRSALEFLAAMINDALDSAGESERFTARRLGRLIPAAELNSVTERVMALVYRSLEGDSSDEPETESKN